jgi:hypothetical protein
MKRVLFMIAMSGLSMLNMQAQDVETLLGQAREVYDNSNYCEVIEKATRVEQFFGVTTSAATSYIKLSAISG